MNQHLLVEFWCHVLAENGCSGGTEQEVRLANFLVKNDFAKLAQLPFADHPREWSGAEGFEEGELELVWGLRSKARKRSR